MHVKKVGAQIRIYFLHLLMKLKNNYLKKKLLKWAVHILAKQEIQAGMDQKGHFIQISTFWSWKMSK